MTESVIWLLYVWCIGYVLGSIPSGFLLAKYGGISDIRKHGSGNIGATNVARVLGKPYFFLVFTFDCFKSYLYLWSLGWCKFSYTARIIASFGLLIGNGYSIFLSFRGGKGMATSFGVLLALAPKLLVGLLVVWSLVLAITHTVGIASVVAMLCQPILALVGLAENSGFLIGLLLFMSIWVLYLHRANIRRYIANLFIPAP
jgi:glycerol-3-phosphate acyltransferase PlsY